MAPARAMVVTSGAGSSRKPCDTTAARAIRSTGSTALQNGAKHLAEKQAERLDAQRAAGDPRHEVTLAWQCYQEVRSVHRARPEKRRELVTGVPHRVPTCPILEVVRLRRILRSWKSATLAYSDSTAASGGPTEAINGIIETTHRIARRFRNFTNCRLKSSFAAGGNRPYREKPINHG